MKRLSMKFDSMSLLVIATAVICVMMLVKAVMLQPSVAANIQKARQIDENVEYEKERIKEIDAVSEKVGTDEYTEKVAREKLGMIKSDEIVFVDISGD